LFVLVAERDVNFTTGFWWFIHHVSPQLRLHSMLAFEPYLQLTSERLFHSLGRLTLWGDVSASNIITYQAIEYSGYWYIPALL
jgi:hypothetical protein